MLEIEKIDFCQPLTSEESPSVLSSAGLPRAILSCEPTVEWVVVIDKFGDLDGSAVLHVRASAGEFDCRGKAGCANHGMLALDRCQ
jgi:hypothetical protein